MRGKFLILIITSLFFSSTASAFWGEKKSIKLCYQYQSGKISTTEIIKKLGLYMPRSIANGRPFFKYEVETYCERTLKE